MSSKRLILPISIVIFIGVLVALFGKWEWLIWGLLLLCPLMHLFGHNHSGHNHSQKGGTKHHH